MKQSEKDFVKENLSADVTKLLLNPPKDFKDRINFLVDQIRSRQKAKDKLPTWYENFDLLFPAPISVEQSSSEKTAEYKSRLVRGENFVDLTGGMGIDCLTFSRRFKSSIYVERDSKLCEIFKANSEHFQLNIEVVNSNAEDFVRSNNIENATVFIDPARRDAANKKVFRFGDCLPNVIELLPCIQKMADQLVVKASPLIDLKQGLKELDGVTEIHIVSVRNECKEVLFILNFDSDQTLDPIIKAVNIDRDQTDEFIFRISREQKANVRLGKAKKYIAVPNSSILKSGAFKLITERFELEKLGSNTHLYSSDRLIDEFPGRQFLVLDGNPDKKRIRDTGKNGVNIITKNYPLSPVEILRKYKLKEGGNDYLIGYRDIDDTPRLLLAELVSA